MSKFLMVFAALLLIMALVFMGVGQFLGHAQYDNSGVD